MYSIRVSDCSIRVYQSFSQFLCLHCFGSKSKRFLHYTTTKTYNFVPIILRIHPIIQECFSVPTISEIIPGNRHMPTDHAICSDSLNHSVTLTPSYKYSFIPSTSRQWNVLPRYIFEAENTDIFKSLLRNYYFCNQ